METAARILALSRRDLPFYEYAREFCGLTGDGAGRHGRQSSVLARGQLLSPRGPPRHHRTELERRDLPVSGKCPGPSQNQPAIRGSLKPAVRGQRKPAVCGEVKPAAIRGSFTPAVRSPRKPAAIRGERKSAARGQPKPAAVRGSFTPAVCGSFTPPRSRPTHSPRRSRPTQARREYGKPPCREWQACRLLLTQVQGQLSTAPSCASPSKALCCARASRAPPSVRASRAPPSARSSPYFPQGIFFGGVVGLQP